MQEKVQVYALDILLINFYIENFKLTVTVIQKPEDNLSHSYNSSNSGKHGHWLYFEMRCGNINFVSKLNY